MSEQPHSFLGFVNHKSPTLFLRLSSFIERERGEGGGVRWEDGVTGKEVRENDQRGV